MSDLVEEDKVPHTTLARGIWDGQAGHETVEFKFDQPAPEGRPRTMEDIEGRISLPDAEQYRAYPCQSLHQIVLD